MPAELIFTIIRDIFLNAIFFGKSEAAFHRSIPRRMLILEVLRATFPILLFLSPDAKNARIGCASHFHARPFDFMNIVGERPSFYNSRRATTRIARRTLQRASNARICKRPLPSPLFGKSTALFPRINQLEFEGSSKANGVVNGVVPRYVLFFSSEISKYRETRRFQDIFLSRNFSLFDENRMIGKFNELLWIVFDFEGFKVFWNFFLCWESSEI